MPPLTTYLDNLAWRCYLKSHIHGLGKVLIWANNIMKIQGNSNPTTKIEDNAQTTYQMMPPNVCMLKCSCIFVGA